ncbi:hypothetical protein CTA1_2605 [Colletotrichum tanaceti]|uniref:Uncharacterized protein n=1 Tax=Colletotrichum tanaceti TaxID=1306861 RepID=A0A4U6X290_9PEZI|nr:hypothetical protein CTA1_2605 [Colletotrichum tanaceti]
MTANEAACLTGQKAKPLEVRPAPYTPPGENEIVVHNRPGCRHQTPSTGSSKKSATCYTRRSSNTPMILGSDVAGQVVEVLLLAPATAQHDSRSGDRVQGHAVGPRQAQQQDVGGRVAVALKGKAIRSPEQVCLGERLDSERNRRGYLLWGFLA